MNNNIKRGVWVAVVLLGCLGLAVSAQTNEVTSNIAPLDTTKAKSSSTSSKHSRYHLVLGNGTSICEDYLKQLNEFPLEDPAMICERKVKPTSAEFEKPKWEEIDLWQHLDWVYEIDYYLRLVNSYSSYKTESKKDLSFDDWRKGYEAKVHSGEIKPRLYRATLAIEDWSTPIPPISAPGTPPPPLVAHQRVWLAYDRGYDRCLDSRESLAIHAGGIYNIFLLDESSTQVESTAFLWSGSNQMTDLIIYRGETYFTHVIGDSADPRKIGSLFIAKPMPPSGQASWKYSLRNTCRIDFTYGNTR